MSADRRLPNVPGAPNPSRRAVLLGSTAGLLLAGCGKQEGLGAQGKRLRPGAVVRSAYGDDPSQFGLLSLPDRATPLATLVLIHGGAWEANYDYRQLEPMTRALVDLGAAVWLIEYRRLGDGGGWPATFEDVARAIDHLAVIHRHHPGMPRVDLTRNVAYVGYSAGGHLAVWAAGRNARTPGGKSAVRPHGVVSLSGPLDLTSASALTVLGKPVRELMGGSVQQVRGHYELGDPIQMVPTPVPVWAVHAEHDGLVPLSQSERYVNADVEAGGAAQLVRVPGTHQTIIDPQERSWLTIRRCIAQATGRPGTSD